MYLIDNRRKGDNPGKEAIHSGHFMVSHFEAEAQDDDEIAVPIPDIPIKDTHEKTIASNNVNETFVSTSVLQPIAIETSLSKLFQCMSIAYRQKLTSPKWNRFRGIRLRWKDKIRLNNVIWRCWHMQFIKKQNTLICQFASPLDVDTHNKPEAIVLEGKYWKRKLEAVTAEYKKWRMFYKNQSFGHQKDSDLFLEMELLKYDFPDQENVNMLIDEDYMGLMSDTLFSTLSNQPFAFPDTREMAKAGFSHFIQPSLGPLQPNLPNNEFMDLDQLDMLNGKLPTVPEEQQDNFNKQMGGWVYAELDLMNTNASAIQVTQQPNIIEQYQTMEPMEPVPIENNRHVYQNEILPHDAYQRGSSSYQSPSVISKNAKIKEAKIQQPQSSGYQNYQLGEIAGSMMPSAEPTTVQLADPREYKAFDPTTASQNFRTNQTSKFATPVTPVDGYKIRNQIQNQPTPMISHQNSKMQQLKEEKSNNGIRSIHRNRRSRSNTREPLKRPPLQTAVSDPSLITPANNMILSQLLTNNTDNVYQQRSAHMSSSSNEMIRCKEENPLDVCIIPPQSNPVIMPIKTTAVQKADIGLQQSTLSTNASHNETSQCLSSPTSPQGSVDLNREPMHREQRRAGHIHAEQKRRYNIKNGFDMMYSLIPHLNQNPNAKLSKAAMLQKGADYIVQLRTERDQLNEEMDSLRQQIESLTTSISNCQSLLPATGAPVSRRQSTKMQEMFDDYVRSRSKDNWKFWIFSLLIQPLLSSFNNFVSNTNLDELYKTTYHWIEQHCSLVDLRPVVFNSLKYLCTKTDILNDPSKLPEEAKMQVQLPSQDFGQQ